MPKNKDKKPSSSYFNIESSDDENSGEQEYISKSLSSTKLSSQFSFSKKTLGINSDSSSNDEDDNSVDLSNDELSQGDLKGNFSDSEDEIEVKETTNKGSKSSLSKKEQQKLKLEMDEFYKVQVVEYSFNVSTTSKKEQLKLNYRDLRINNASCQDDFDSISTIKKSQRASQNSDIVLNLEICNLKTNYPGNIKIDFPTVKQLNNHVGYQGEKHMSYQKTHRKDKGKVLIDRNLDDGQKSFLKSYPGNTSENFDSYCKTSPNNKIINVGLQPTSCIMYFFENAKEISDKDKKNIFNVHIRKRNPDVFEMPIKLYNHLKNTAIDNLEKNFSFSDISSKKFNIIIYPLMSSTTQNAINKKIQRLEKESKIDNEKSIEILKRKGFSNFYNTNPQSNLNLDSQIEEFVSKPQKYTFEGIIKISYFQVKNPIQERVKKNK
jgi:hypothetical protein